jgi:hypothetical protein
MFSPRRKRCLRHPLRSRVHNPKPYADKRRIGQRTGGGKLCYERIQELDCFAVRVSGYREIGRHGPSGHIAFPAAIQDHGGSFVVGCAAAKCGEQQCSTVCVQFANERIRRAAFRCLERIWRHREITRVSAARHPEPPRRAPGPSPDFVGTRSADVCRVDEAAAVGRQFRDEAFAAAAGRLLVGVGRDRELGRVRVSGK